MGIGLSEAQRQELLAALGNPAPYGGLWSSAKVARWIGEKLGRKVWPQRAGSTCATWG